jgi:hypothetical protein
VNTATSADSYDTDLDGPALSAVLVSGLMAAFVTVLRIGKVGGGNTEAMAYAQEVLERLRNHVACDDTTALVPPGWFDASCAFAAPINVSPDPTLPAGVLYNSGTRSYSVTAADCNLDGAPGDCFKVVTTVAWVQPQ